MYACMYVCICICTSMWICIMYTYTCRCTDMSLRSFTKQSGSLMHLCSAMCCTTRRRTSYVILIHANAHVYTYIYIYTCFFCLASNNAWKLGQDATGQAMPGQARPSQARPRPSPNYAAKPGLVVAVRGPVECRFFCADKCKIPLDLLGVQDIHTIHVSCEDLLIMLTFRNSLMLSRQIGRAS